MIILLLLYAFFLLFLALCNVIKVFMIADQAMDIESENSNTIDIFLTTAERTQTVLLIASISFYLSFFGAIFMFFASMDRFEQMAES